MINVKDLVKDFRNNRVLRGITTTVEDRDKLVIVGPRARENQPSSAASTC